MFSINFKKVFLLFVLAFTILIPITSFAAADPSSANSIKLQIPISSPNSKAAPITDITTCNGDSCPGISQYIAAIYAYGVSIAGFVAIIIMMYGGFLWLSAGGNSGQIDNAKKYLSGAISGIILLFGSYTLLYLVNPDIVSLPNLSMTKVTNRAIPRETDVALSDAVTKTSANSTANFNTTADVQGIVDAAKKAVSEKHCEYGTGCVRMVTYILNASAYQTNRIADGVQATNSLKQELEKRGWKTIGCNQLQAGDVVFTGCLRNDNTWPSGHVGVTTSDKTMVHNSSAAGGCAAEDEIIFPTSINKPTECGDDKIKVPISKWNNHDCVLGLRSTMPTSSSSTAIVSDTGLKDPVDLGFDKPERLKSGGLLYSKQSTQAVRGKSYLSFGTARKNQIIIHHTAGAMSDVTGFEYPKMCHYLITKIGDLKTGAPNNQVVRCQWGADIQSIGIELESDSTGNNFTKIQLDKAVALVKQLASEKNIPLNNNIVNLGTSTGGVFSHAYVCQKYYELPGGKDSLGTQMSGYSSSIKWDVAENVLEYIIKNAGGNYTKQDRSKCPASVTTATIK